MMAAMKYSGAKWIGDIPKEWCITRLKDQLKINNGKEIDNDEGKIPVYGSGGAFKWTDKVLCNEPALLLGRKGTVDRPLLVKEPFWTVDTMFYSTLKNEACLDYLYFCSTCFDYKYFQTGSTLPSMTQTDLGSILLPWPCVNEQYVIASYLNRKCMIADKAIMTLESQISTLERHRSSVIHEAVTCGINPQAPTKQCSLDWFSAIPKEWDVSPFKYIANVDANLVNPEEYPDLLEIDPENIESNSGRLLNVRTVAEVGAISAKQLFSKGQIIYSKIRPALNKVAIAPDRGLCSADMYPIKTSANVRWLSYAMRDTTFVSQTTLESGRVAMPKINVQALGKIWIAVPPIEEQAAIADYLDARTAAIDAVLDTKRKQLDILKRRRQSLIYEYVTGKRRVIEEA